MAGDDNVRYLMAGQEYTHEVAMLKTVANHSGFVPLFKSRSRLGCTLFGSPGIFG